MRVAVIGAGVSGITSAKCLLDVGIEPVVFERAAGPGGVWRYDETLPDGGGPAYRGLHTNTSKQTTAFSDFPFPAALPDFPPRAAVLQYLNDYADHFDVFDRIQFATEVLRVEPLDGGRWNVRTRSPDGEAAAVFDAVMGCSGVFTEPVTPHVPGIETWTGTIGHSQGYTVPDHFADQTVVVVGSGSSATDVALEASAVARQVFLSVRGSDAPAPPPPPAGFVATMRGWRDRAVPKLVRTRLHRYWQLVRARRRLPGPDAPFVLGVEPFKPNPKLHEPIAAGTVVVRPGIASLDGNHVHWTDGTAVEADAVVFATGYVLRLPYLDPAIFEVSMEGLDLYRLVCLPDWPTLAFVGLFRVSGPAPPVAEMQARWAAHIFRGDIQLPTPDEQRAAVAHRRTLVKQHGGNPFRLFAEAYEDILASEIGALPRLWRRPRLWRAILAGPPIAARHRLDGPNSWIGAAQTLLDAEAQSAKRKAQSGEQRSAERRTQSAEQA